VASLRHRPWLDPEHAITYGRAHGVTGDRGRLSEHVRRDL
jgi:hypothetical protein